MAEQLILIRLNLHVPLKMVHGIYTKIEVTNRIVKWVPTRKFHDIKESLEIQMDKKIDLFRMLFSSKILMSNYVCV